MANGGNKIPIGLIQHLPDASRAWAEVERLHVPINRVDVRRGWIFGDLAQHYAEHELAEASESIRPKAHTTFSSAVSYGVDQKVLDICIRY